MKVSRTQSIIVSVSESKIVSFSLRELSIPLEGDRKENNLTQQSYLDTFAAHISGWHNLEARNTATAARSKLS